MSVCGEEHRLQETLIFIIWLKVGGARKEVKSKFVRMSLSGERCSVETCHGCNEIWGLSVGFCFLPSPVSWYHLRVSSADSGHALEVCAPPLLTLSGLAWQQKSHSGPSGWIQAGRTHGKSPCFRVLEGVGVGGQGWRLWEFRVLCFLSWATACCCHGQCRLWPLGPLP